MILAGSTSSLSPQRHLNDVYMTVLNSTVHEDYLEEEKEDMYSVLKQILGTLVLLYSPLSVKSLSALLGLALETINGGIADLNAILDIPKYIYRPLRLHHPSFRDFLLDLPKSGSNPFRVNETETHERIATRCLQLMGCLKGNLCNLGGPGTIRTEVDKQVIDEHLLVHVQYACSYWVNYLEKSKGCIRDGNRVLVFLQEHLLYWLEAMSLMGKASECVALVATLQITCLRESISKLKEYTLFKYNFLNYMFRLMKVPRHLAFFTTRSALSYRTDR